ncbi:MAG TPA: helix-turn-helix domain-containing protein [Solirubrobacteraceae bacterium]|nr:helix-turn-helix domain-containing protein [Solirubrobacteraceae bacterium]
MSTVPASESPEARTRRGPGRPPGGPLNTRAALLDAGRELFATQGYATATARDIVERAGCTAPVLYHHFGNKAGLFAAVVKDVNDLILGHFAEAIEGKRTLLERIEAILDESVRMYDVAPSVGRFVVAAPLELARHPELRIAAGEMLRLGQFIEQMCADGAGVQVEPHRVEYIVQTLIYGLSRMAASPRPVEYVHAVDALKTLLRGQVFTQ